MRVEKAWLFRSPILDVLDKARYFHSQFRQHSQQSSSLRIKPIVFTSEAASSFDLPTSTTTLRSNMFGVVFPNRSFPIDISTFSQIDTFHWLLDMNTFVGESYDQIREVCIFLLNNFTLPPDKALAVYIQSPGSPFLYCGAVTIARPSAVLSLPWPEPGGSGQLQLTADAQPLSAKIGVSVEDLATLPSLDVTAEKRIERLALKVGENLFNFMQSFCGVDGSRLVVPMDILDRWFKKFQERAKRDPEYLKGFAL